MCYRLDQIIKIFNIYKTHIFCTLRKRQIKFYHKIGHFIFFVVKTFGKKYPSQFLQLYSRIYKIIDLCTSNTTTLTFDSIYINDFGR